MKNILLVDDDPSVLWLIGRALEEHGYRLIRASSGEEGVAAARQHLPDLILCDINMPGTDGRTVLQVLREDPELASKQIVLITGDPSSVTPRAGMELGADDFLVKPIAMEALLRCVEARLKRAEVHWRVEDRVLKGLRSTLATTLPHEFFTPLAGVLGLVEVLRSDLALLSRAEIRAMLDDIERSGNRLHRTLKNYLMILDLEGRPVTAARAQSALSAEQAREVLETAIDLAAKRHRRTADVTLAVNGGTTFVLPLELATIAEELVDNACNYSRKGTPVSVHLNSERLRISDNGRGMTADEIRQIGAFRQFDRKKYEQQGLGLGLVLVQKLAARSGARLKLDSEPGRGTIADLIFTSARI